MGAVVTYLVYLVISVSLTVGAGLALSRSGRVFLRDVFGGDQALAEAVNRLLVVGFYLLTLGFVVLAMRPSGDISSVRQAAGGPVREDRRGAPGPGRAAPDDLRHLPPDPAPPGARRDRSGPGRAAAGARPPPGAPSRASCRATRRTYIDHCGRA